MHAMKYFHSILCMLALLLMLCTQHAVHAHIRETSNYGVPSKDKLLRIAEQRRRKKKPFREAAKKKKDSQIKEMLTVLEEKNADIFWEEAEVRRAKLSAEVDIYAASGELDEKYNTKDYDCVSHSSCNRLHLQHTILDNQIMQYRQNYLRSQQNTEQNHTNGMSFIHVPKAAGTFVKRSLRLASKKANSAFHYYGHAPYVVMNYRYPDDQMVTIVRDPIDKAISLWNYANGFDYLKTLPKKDFLILQNRWKDILSVSPEVYSNSNITKSSAYFDTLFYLTADLDDSSKLVQSKLYEQEPYMPDLRHALRKEGVKPKKAFFPLENEQDDIYMSYIDKYRIPIEFQCRRHIAASLNVMKRFVCIGVVDDMKTFDACISSIFRGKNMSFLNKNGPHYASKARMNKEQEKVVRKNLADVLFCETLLVDILRSIGQEDAKSRNALPLAQNDPQLE